MNLKRERETKHLILIPSYNTGDKLIQTVREALQQHLDVWVIIDGSTDKSEEALTQAIPPTDSFRIISSKENKGKGAAVYMGAKLAHKAGYTHILTMDSDGQHPSTQIPEFLKHSDTIPDAMILGLPTFDDTAPKVRVYGRKLSIYMAFLQTQRYFDPLFGLRVYPLEAFLDAFGQTRWARGFDFDPEIATRMHWNGVPFINVQTPVYYYEEKDGGVSHFNYLRDNLRLIWMHTRLISGRIFNLLPF